MKCAARTEVEVMIGQRSETQPAAGAGAKRKLLDQVRAAVRVRHMAFSTEKAYVHGIRRFILFHIAAPAIT